MFNNRKRFSSVLACITTCFLSLPISSAMASEKDLAWEVINASGMIEGMEIAQNEGLKAAIAPIAQQLEPLGDCGIPVIKALEADIASLMTPLSDKTLLEATAKVYAEKFSVDELRVMLEFYKSPVGRKLKKLAPDLAQVGVEAGQKAMMDVMPTFQTKIQETMLRAGAEAQQCMAGGD